MSQTTRWLSECRVGDVRKWLAAEDILSLEGSLGDSVRDRLKEYRLAYSGRNDDDRAFPHVQQTNPFFVLVDNSA